MEERTYDAYIKTDSKEYQLRITEEEFRELTNAALYGSGWFRYREGADLLMLNLRQARSVRVVPCE